jgi:hypothetical protein
MGRPAGPRLIALRNAVWSAPIYAVGPTLGIASTAACRIADPEGSAKTAFVKARLAASLLNGGILSLILVHVVSISHLALIIA